MKVLCVVIAALLSVVAGDVSELPVKYLPPGSGGHSMHGNMHGGAGSHSYLPPGAGGIIGGHSGHVGKPSAQYGVPGFNRGQMPFGPSGGAHSGHHGGPGGFIGGPAMFGLPGSALSPHYGTPGFNRGQSFGASGRYPKTQYGVPGGAIAPIGGFSIPGFSSLFGAASTGGSYGGLGFSRPNYSGYRGDVSSQYGVPGSAGYRFGSREDDMSVPANYQFSYMVQDPATLTDFAHQEARQGDAAQGEYSVLLPDGRKQTVRYQADQNGYRPEVSYQDTGITGINAFSRGQGFLSRQPGQGTSGGYHY